MKKILRDQPLLVGCVVALVLATLFCGAGLGLVARGCGKATRALGLRSFPGALAAASQAGFGLGVEAKSGQGVHYSMEPFSPREVDCAELFEVLGPHITDDAGTIVIRSRSTVLEDGVATEVAVECTWAGVPVPTSETPH